MKYSLPVAFLLSFSLAAHGLAADKKPKGTPSTLPPTSPMLVVPKPDAAAADGTQPGKLISSEMNGRDLEFFMKAVEAGREQAFFVDLLKKIASSDRIKTLADTLATAQAEENTHIVKLATQKGLTVSLEPTAVEKRAAEKLAKLTGSNFDKAAMDIVAAANSQALAAYQDAAQSTDPQIKSFAAQMLPLAEEKRHIVEKMTGAGSKTANELFRHGGASEGDPVATPAATTDGKGTPSPSSKTTPKPSSKSAPPPLPSAKSTPASTLLQYQRGWVDDGPSVSAKSAPAGTSASSPILGLPVATPPGQGPPPSILPPIVPPKVPPTPVPVK